MLKFGIFLATIPITILKAFVMTKIWSWFIIPLGFPQIGIWHACGILTIISFISLKWRDDDDTEIQMLNKIIYVIINSLVAWGFAYIFYLLMQAL